MTEDEARDALPGAGDLIEKINKMHNKHGAPECEDFTLEHGEELLDWLSDWLADEVDDDDEDDDEDDFEYDEDDAEGPEPEHRESDSDDN